MEAAFSTQPSAISENQQQKQKPFTTEDAEESKGLPLMNADERGLQDRVKQVNGSLRRICTRTGPGENSPYRYWRPRLYRDPSTRPHLLPGLGLAQMTRGIGY